MQSVYIIEQRINFLQIRAIKTISHTVLLHSNVINKGTQSVVHRLPIV